ncbi:MAG: alpha-L-fucosidase [Oscillospiraceae bacterium]|nr:alpha-L-fucosidase [Oscillospiraceae bacterium]
MNEQVFKPTWESVETHGLPSWYDDSKLGIFIHWGLYSVPAWAEVTWELGGAPSELEWFTHNPYAEWYQNTIRIENSPARVHHNKTYGADFPYEKFADSFTCEKWNPAEWAKLFKEAGAGYVVLTTKHHDGFCLYPSEFTDYNSMNLGPKRDLTGELASAVRTEGLRMGTYYSGLLDWTTYPYPHTGDISKDYNQTYSFSDYSFNQAMELIDKYKPSLLWGDIGWPDKGIRDLPWLFSHYYNNVPDGVINDRFSCDWYDHMTAEYLIGRRSLEKKWEMSRGMGLSFGYNINEGDETVQSGRNLVRMLVEFTSHNGNLLLNVGPRADGTIPENQILRLKDLGAWLKKYGDSIYGTRIWHERQKDTLPNGADVFYTRKSNDLYAIIDNLPPGDTKVKLPIYTTELPIERYDDYPVPIKLKGFFGL